MADDTAAYEHAKRNGMLLPTDKTCADCMHLRRCQALFGVSAENAWCDFYPVRFVEAAR